MKTSDTLACAISLVAASVFVGVPSGDAVPATHADTAPTASRISTRIDTVVRRAIRDEHFSGTVLVRQGPKILLRKGYGLADTRRRNANTPSTSFALPGITTLFTEVAIEQLAEHGRLAARSVAQVRAGQGSARLTASIRLIERVSGESYSTYLQRHLFEPLGMTHTGVRGHAGAIPEFYSSVDDLDRWNQAVLGCMLVSPQALFWSIAPGQKVLEAGGAQRGAAAGERLVLSGDTAIMVLANKGVDVRHLLAAIQGVLPPT